MSGQVCYTLADLERWETAGAGLQPPARLAVIGDPVAHSRSPQMHNPALIERGIEAQYIRVQVPAGAVKEALRLFALGGFWGVNCTIPHKFEALEAVDEADGLARMLGAVNTVVMREGRTLGFNSDGPGFVAAVEEAFGRPLGGVRVLIFGAGGGAGQAVALQCAASGCARLRLINRSPKIEGLLSRLRSVNGALDVQGAVWEEAVIRRYVEESDLIVNATSLGLKEGDAAVLPREGLEARHLVFDMVYRAQGSTPLVQAAREAGAAACDGLPLLLHQGAVSFGHWFGLPVPLEAMRRGLEAA